MNLDELRAKQAPLKEKYKEHPEAAVVKVRAEGMIAGGLVIDVKTPHGVVKAGMHAATGGDGVNACSAEMLLEALVGCAGVTLSAVSTAMGIDIGKSKIEATADWDVRGTLGVVREAPIGLQNIKLHFTIDSKAEADKIAKMIQLTERYCVVFQTLKNPPIIATSYK